MKKLIISIAAIVVILLVLLAVVSTFFLGAIVKKGVETAGPPITKTELTLDSATLSLLSGSGSIKGLFVGNPEGYKTPAAIRVGAVELGVRPGSVFSDKVHVTRVAVKAPEITFEGGLEGNNLSKILANVQAASGSSSPDKTKPEQTSSKKLQVDDLLITGGKINLVLTSLGPLSAQSLTVPLPEIHFTDLGRGAEGLTGAELTQRILNEINANALKAAQKALADLGKVATDAAKAAAQDAVKEASNAATQALDKATKSLGDLFKKK